EIVTYTPERTYGLDELIDYFLGASPILPEPTKQPINGRDKRPADVFEQYASNFQPSHVDVDERLANMRFKGGRNVNTQDTACGNRIIALRRRALRGRCRARTAGNKGLRESRPALCQMAQMGTGGAPHRKDVLGLDCQKPKAYRVPARRCPRAVRGRCR